MKIDFEGARLYVRPGSTDLRKGVTGLLAIIENEMHLDALSNSVFFFEDLHQFSSGQTGSLRKDLRWQPGHGRIQARKQEK